MKADITVLDAAHKEKTPLAEEVLQRAGEKLGLQNARCEVYIVNDAEIEALARRVGHAYHKGITVLSFPASKDFPRPDLVGERDLGEIYINPGYIKKQKEDFSCILIHGLLHLAGYDHTGKYDTLIMEAKEKEIMRTIHTPTDNG